MSYVIDYYTPYPYPKVKNTGYVIFYEYKENSIYKINDRLLLLKVDINNAKELIYSMSQVHTTEKKKIMYNNEHGISLNSNEIIQIKSFVGFSFVEKAFLYKNIYIENPQSTLEQIGNNIMTKDENIISVTVKSHYPVFIKSDYIIAVHIPHPIKYEIYKIY